MTDFFRYWRFQLSCALVPPKSFVQLRRRGRESPASDNKHFPVQ
jgi:hypothetical protein